MNPDRYARVRELFLEARQRDSGDRRGYLDEACSGDTSLLGEVESLLANDDRASTFLSTPALGGDFAVGEAASSALGSKGRRGSSVGSGTGGGSSAAPAPPERIGPYRIVATIGQGGMGVVYEAEQEKPRRMVALKVLKPGVESEEMLRRFEYEGQVLGWLQHPGIAQVFEAGSAATEGGCQPYFAMELVRGRPLTAYAEAESLDVPRRLELMARVCDAVHHAHQKGVIHRDLKPGNILVDKEGQPKVLDFGVARATDADIRTTTLQTNVGQLIGTIAYMSPEQVSGDTRQLDTRSDIYALGVVLYELLTGRLPHDVGSKSIPEAARSIAEEEPTSLRSINRLYRGDVETIVAKALEKDKDRRYQSACDLAMDIRRYLTDQPITARPATTGYQLRKFARRNKPLAISLVVAFALLVGGLIQLARERNRAFSSERLAESRRVEADARRVEAEGEARKSKAMNDFLQRMLASVDPEHTLGREVSFRSFLEQVGQRMETELGGEPEVEVTIRGTLGRTYRKLGLYAEAAEHLERALADRRKLDGDDHALTYLAMNELALTFQEQGKLSEAEPLYRRALEGQRRLLGNEHPVTLLAITNLGWLLRARGEHSEAAKLLEESLNLRRRVSGEDHLETIRSMVTLAGVQQQMGKLGEGERLSGEAYDRCLRVLGEAHPVSLYALRTRVWLVLRVGRWEEAESLARESFALDRRVLGESHPHAMYSMENLAAVFMETGRSGEAVPLYRRLLIDHREKRGENHTDTLVAIGNLARALYWQGKSGEAESLYDELLDRCRRLFGGEHPRTLRAISALAKLYRDGGRVTDAEPLLEETLAAQVRVLGEVHEDTLMTRQNLAAVYLDRDRAAESEPLYRAVYEARDATLGKGHLRTRSSMRGLSAALIKLRRFDEAEELALGCLTLTQESYGTKEIEVKSTRSVLYDLYIAWGRPDEAAIWRAKAEGGASGLSNAP